MIDQVGDRNRLTVGEDVETTLAARQLGLAPAWAPNVWYQTILEEAGKPSMIMSLKCARLGGFSAAGRGSLYPIGACRISMTCCNRAASGVFNRIISPGQDFLQHKCDVAYQQMPRSPYALTWSRCCIDPREPHDRPVAHPQHVRIKGEPSGSAKRSGSTLADPMDWINPVPKTFESGGLKTRTPCTDEGLPTYDSRPPTSVMYFSYSSREIRPPSRSTRARSFADKKICTSSTRFHGASGVSDVERGTNADV
jgi:hypothetical protein